MSRSRRAPYVTHKQHKKDKQLAAKRVRRKQLDEDVADGAGFRKESNSWDIQDHGWYDPKYEKARRK
jgi:hypothetical protein